MKRNGMERGSPLTSQQRASLETAMPTVKKLIGIARASIRRSGRLMSHDDVESLGNIVITRMAARHDISSGVPMAVFLSAYAVKDIVKESFRKKSVRATNFPQVGEEEDDRFEPAIDDPDYIENAISERAIRIEDRFGTVWKITPDDVGTDHTIAIGQTLWEVLIAIYFEGLSQKQISFQRGLSESRISQLHTEALRRIAESMTMQRTPVSVRERSGRSSA